MFSLPSGPSGMTSGRPPCVRVSRACLLLAVDDQAPAGGARRLDGALDDHGQEGERVVGRGQRLAEAVDRLLDALALRRRSARTSR